MSRRQAKATGGFTLLEVLVAMTIDGLGEVTLLQVFSLGLRLQSRSLSHSEAVAQATRIMDELLASRRIDGTLEGRVAPEGRWTAQVRAVPEPPTALGLARNWELKELALELTFRDGAMERQVELKTFRLGRKANP